MMQIYHALLEHISRVSRSGRQQSTFGNRSGHRLSLFATLLLTTLLSTNHAYAFRVHDVPEVPGSFGGGILRWNAAPHFVDGVERSLDGGLRYSIEGGSYEAFRDQFQWEGTPPSAADLQQAVEQAFADWEVVDPETGLITAVRFVPDFDTPVVIETLPPDLAGRARLNRGAEIDIAAAPLDPSTGGQADSFGDPNAHTVTLTSGVSGYPAVVSSGADIRMTDGYPWQLPKFQSILSHEIGHVLGLTDVDAFNGALGVVTEYYDDNFDGTSSATALATLTNSFAALIDPFDPDKSAALELFEPCVLRDPSDFYSCTSEPGLDTPGVDIHMESSVTKGGSRLGLVNDDFAGRQFLYPTLRGDFDADNVLTVQDMDVLLPGSGYDLTADGLVDLEDRRFWIENLFGSFFGDADLNREVGFADFLSLSTNFGKQGGWEAGDFDGSGDVQFADFLLLSSNFGASAAAAVPEPNTGSLVLLVYIGIGGRLRHRMRSKL